jgi:hypothetical protein
MPSPDALCAAFRCALPQRAGDRCSDTSRRLAESSGSPETPRAAEQEEDHQPQGGVSVPGEELAQLRVIEVPRTVRAELRSGGNGVKTSGSTRTVNPYMHRLTESLKLSSDVLAIAAREMLGSKARQAC